MAHVAFLWHMHQPSYVDPATGVALMPWVRLHCAKGYLDMVSVLADYPGVRANFNLSPILVRQIRDLLEGRVRDEWLELSRKPAAALTEDERFRVLENFFKANWEHLVRPHPRYWELLNKRGLTLYRDDVRRGVRYFSAQEILDVQVWFNLTWCGYTARRLFPELDELRRKERGFTEVEKQRVLDIHLALMRLVLARYREAEERGQIELTTTPFFHPILPLLHDSDLAARAMPGRDLPRRFAWPQDVAAQLQLAVDQHAAVFGRAPRGCWPSEGAMAPEIIPALRAAGFTYFCGDEENLFRSFALDPAWRGTPVDHLELFQGWRVRHGGAEIAAVFREHPLSDFIGFTAAKNEPGQAARHLLFHLRHIADLTDHRAVIPLFLDGENAWEFFPDGGEAFLRSLYSGLENQRDRLPTITLDDYLRAHPPQRQLNTLHTGSWIGANLDIWIGEAEENRAWERLGETRAWLQARLEARVLTPAQEAAARAAIYAAEGSDWFWWYGPDYSTENDPLFDHLFRAQLRAVYAACGAVPPATLDVPITERRVEPLFLPPSRPVTPEINGARASFFEWTGAGRYDATEGVPQMARTPGHVARVFFGHDAEYFYLCVEFHRPPPGEIEIYFGQPEGLAAKIAPLLKPGPVVATLNGGGKVLAAYAEILEVALPLAALGLRLGDPVAFQIRLQAAGVVIESHPPGSLIAFPLLAADWALEQWMV
jgi:alpha-amylase/alpha-mannosidase (GH57 family)